MSRAAAPARPEPSRLGTCSRTVLRAVVRVFLRIYFRLRVTNPPTLPGGYVVVANHVSFLDPIILGAANPQHVAFLINGVSYRNRLLGWFYRMYRSIPIDLRGVSRATLRSAHAALEGGEVVGIFPEGGVSRDGGQLLGNPGAVALVLSKGVSVVPVGLLGVREALPYGASLPRPHRIEVRFGAPIPATELMVGDDRKARLANATTRLMREIAKLTGGIAREDEVSLQKS